MHQSLLLCFENWKEDSETKKLFENNNLMYLLEDTFYIYLEKIIEDYPMFKDLNLIQKYFIVGGLTHSMVFGLSTYNPESPMEVSKSILDMFNFNSITLKNF